MEGIPIQTITVDTGTGMKEWGWNLKGSEVEEFHRREESRVCHQDLLSRPGMGVEREERPQQGSLLQSWG